MVLAGTPHPSGVTTSSTSPAREQSAPTDPSAWLAPIATALALPPIAVADLWFLGLAATSADGCTVDGPCRAAEAIDHAYLFAVVAAVVGLTATIATRWPPMRPYRWVCAGLTLIGAAWPVVWIIAGNPRP